MAALIPDKILIGVVSLNFFLPIKMQHVIHGTSAATYNRMEVNRNDSLHDCLNGLNARCYRLIS